MFPMNTPMGQQVNFPRPEPRPGQLEAIDNLHGICSRNDYALFCAGTGFGKSATLVGLASLYPDSWLVVGGNVLVEQWRRDFELIPGIGCMKSRSQFGCALLAGRRDREGLEYTCRSGQDLCDGMRENMSASENAESPCPYAINRDMALGQRHVIMTTTMALTMFTYMQWHPGVKRRALMVVDECSELEGDLISFYEIVLKSRWVCDLLGVQALFSELLLPSDPLCATIGASTTIGEFLATNKPENLDQGKEWLSTIAQLATAKLQKLGTKNTKERADIDDFLGKIKRIALGMEMSVPYFCKTVQKEWEKEHEYTVKVSPLEACGLFDRIMGTMAEQCVFSSATTGTADLFRATHRMARNITYVEAGTPFPAAHRPFLYAPRGNLSFRTFERDADKVVAAAVQIASSIEPGGWNDHARQKGVIHTVSDKLTQRLLAALDRPGLRGRVVRLQGEGKQRGEAIDTFKKSTEPLILVSPSAMLGISLDDEMARWQIICKVPFGDIKDPAIEHRMINIPGWYTWQAIKNILQAYGRIIRSPEDWGKTYVLDEAFWLLYYKNRRFFPTHFQAAYWQENLMGAYGQS